MEESGKRTVSFDKPMYLAHLNNSFRFRHSWQASLDYSFNSSFNYGNVDITNATHMLEVSIQKSMLKNDAMTIRLSATDILNRMVENNYVDFGPLDCRQSNDSRRPAIILRASYHFTSASSKYRGTGAGQDVMQRL